MSRSSDPNDPGETSYIVRLYRRVIGGCSGGSAPDSGSPAGMVERTDNGERAEFRSIEELWQILAGKIPCTHPRIPSKGEED